MVISNITNTSRKPNIQRYQRLTNTSQRSCRLKEIGFLKAEEEIRKLSKSWSVISHQEYSSLVWQCFQKSNLIVQKCNARAILSRLNSRNLDAEIYWNLDCNQNLSEFNNSVKLAAIPSFYASKSMTESDVDEARTWPTTKNNIQVTDNQSNSHKENEVMNLDSSINEILTNLNGSGQTENVFYYVQEY